MPAMTEQLDRLSASTFDFAKSIEGPLADAAANLTPTFRAMTDTTIAGFAAAGEAVTKFGESLNVDALSGFTDFLKNDLLGTLVATEFAFQNVGATADLAFKNAEKSFLQFGASISQFDPTTWLKFLPDFRGGANKFKRIDNDPLVAGGLAAVEALGNAKNAARIAALDEEMMKGFGRLMPDFGQFFKRRLEELNKPFAQRPLGPKARIAGDDDAPPTPDKQKTDSGANSDFTALRGTKEALSSIFAAMRGSGGGDVQQKTLVAQQQAVTELKNANGALTKLASKNMEMIAVNF